MTTDEAMQIAKECRPIEAIVRDKKPGIFSPREQACVILADEVLALRAACERVEAVCAKHAPAPRNPRHYLVTVGDVLDALQEPPP